ncbi:MAG: 5'-nucleotidase C-terminal domain-containing protein [Marinicella sp.]|nr:5'-nucleotidase C-terminal domain-containing protein [Xanthomonadales bacterium]
MKNHILKLLSVFIVCSACQHATKNNTSEQNSEQKLAIISINDVYRIAGINNGKTGGLARVRELRKQIEAQYQHVLFLHAGDFLHPSFTSKQDNGLAMIQTMNMLDGTLGQFDDRMLVTWGNHEFDKGKNKHIPIMNELLAQSEFTWLDSNINWQPDSLQSEKMSKSTIITFGDHKVGVFSYSTDIVHPEYIESFIGFKDIAEHYVPLLRNQGADFVIALTHQWLPDDLAMMELPENIRPDIIFGGHEHYVQTEQVNGRWILKADADAASAIVAEVTFDDNRHQVMPQVVQLDEAFAEDQDTVDLVQQLTQNIDKKYCEKLNREGECLSKVLGYTKNQLMAEETEIRRFETNLGNTLADMILEQFQSCDADVVLLNSGSIRLNQNIPAGSGITVKHLEEMFPYPSDLRLIEFERPVLMDVLAHSISSWTANGHWLQIAGFVFIHDPDKQQVSHVHLKGELEGGFENRTDDKTTIRAVLPYYLISDSTDHDGYTMLNENMQVTCEQSGAQVKAMFKELLESQSEPLEANRDYRICNTTRDQCH